VRYCSSHRSFSDTIRSLKRHKLVSRVFLLLLLLFLPSLRILLILLLVSPLSLLFLLGY
jgi:hypothetical protein